MRLEAVTVLAAEMGDVDRHVQVGWRGLEGRSSIPSEHALTAAVCLNEDMSMVTFNGGM